MRTTIVALACLLTATACGEAVSSSNADPESPLAGIGLTYVNTPLPGVVTAGQITPEQLEQLVQKGYKNFVCLREASEKNTGWEEDEADALGARFVRIPVKGAAGLDLANATRLDEALKGAGGAETVVYCGSSNRVGALFACRAYWLQGASREDALTLGKAAGATRYVEHIETLLQKK